MPDRILILGATGLLGRSVVDQLGKGGYSVRALARHPVRARAMLGNGIDIQQGDALDARDIDRAMEGCSGVHISLPQSSELEAVEYVIRLAKSHHLGRISYVSATTVREENRWFDLIETKLKCEEMLGRCGVPTVIFRPTWVMETLLNFARHNPIPVIVGKNPPNLHFFAGRDFGRMVAASYRDDRAVGKRLFVHGPEGFTLPEAVERFARICFPDRRVRHLNLWKAQLAATLTGREGLQYVTRLIAYFDKVGELGDPTEANALYGAPTTTLDDWIQLQIQPLETLPIRG